MKNGTIVCHLLAEGFYNQINHVINTYIYALQRNYLYRLVSDQFIYKVEKGWEDFFLPFWDEARENIEPVLHIDYSHHREFDLAKTEHIAVPEHGLVANDIFSNVRLMVPRIYRYNERTESFLEQEIQGLGLPENYAAFHVRRGDKVYHSRPRGRKHHFSEYLDKLSAHQDTPGVVFVATDDFSVIQEFRQYISENGLRVDIVSTCEPEDQGFSVSTVRDLSSRDKYRILLDAEVCSRARYFVGTYSSGVSRFVAAKHANPDHCFSLDIEWCHDGSRTSHYSRTVLNRNKRRFGLARWFRGE